MINIELNMDFPHDYEVEIGGDLPTDREDSKILYFSNRINKVGCDGLMVKVTPNDIGKQWCGVFGFGQVRGSKTSGVFSCPNKRMLCVVSEGRAYVIFADLATAALDIKAFPVITVVVAKDAGLLLLVDFIKIVALDEHGILWTTDRLSSDGLKILNRDKINIWVEGWDAAKSMPVKLKINLENGKVVDT